MPTTFGTWGWGGCPLETVIWTMLPSGTTAPPPGLCPITVPAGAFDGADPATTPEKFALDRTFSACRCGSPMTLGTVLVFGGGGAGQSSAGRPLVIAAIALCQISVGMVPPNISGTPSTPYMGRGLRG